MAHTHEVAIYAPYASLFYERRGHQGGGAELQTTLLARGLAERGLRVAHILYPLKDPVDLTPPAPDVVEREPHKSQGRFRQLAEGAAVWRGLAKADATAYIVRGSGGHLIPAAAFCRARRRRLVFSTSNDLDFDFQRPDRPAWVLRAYERSIRAADRVVLQTRRQRELAEAAIPSADPVVIPSFSQMADRSEAEPEYLLWADRLVPYKHPEHYLELARRAPDIRLKMILSPTSETPAGLMDRIRSEGESLPNLELLPPRPRDQLLAETARAAAVVCTSAWEGMPNRFLEAWARGVPVLSLSVDPDDRISEKDIGIYAGGSMDRFVEGAAALWTERARRAEMGDRARQFVRETHSPDAVADRWAELLRGLLAGGRP